MEQVITVLQGLADQQALKENALKFCQAGLRQCILDDVEVGAPPLSGWSLEEIKLRCDHISLVFEHDILDYSYIETQIGLYVDEPMNIHFGSLKPIGHYRLITLLDGSIDDTYLVIDVEKTERVRFEKRD